MRRDPRAPDIPATAKKSPAEISIFSVPARFYFRTAMFRYHVEVGVKDFHGTQTKRVQPSSTHWVLGAARRSHDHK